MKFAGAVMVQVSVDKLPPKVMAPSDALAAKGASDVAMDQAKNFLRMVFLKRGLRGGVKRSPMPRLLAGHRGLSVVNHRIRHGGIHVTRNAGGGGVVLHHVFQSGGIGDDGGC